MTRTCRNGNHPLDARTLAAGGEVCFDCASAPVPAIFTEPELRAWLRSIGLTGVRLNRALDRVQYIAVPNGRDVWIVKPLITGAFTVEPYRSEGVQP